MNKTSLVIGAVVALLIGFAVGTVLSPAEVAVAPQGVSSVGSSNFTARLASITMAPSTASATTTSILNNGGTDRAIESAFISCNTVGTSQTFTTGAGLSAWNLKIATTSVASTGLQGNTNYAADMSISTSTADAYSATSTNPAPNPVSRIWPVNTYLTFLFNATNTAACTVGAHYLVL